MNELIALKNTFFEDILNPKSNNVLNLEVENKDNEILIKTEVPGINKENIQIELENGNLIITATKKKEIKEDNFSEFIYGTFKRVIHIGNEINRENIKANLHNGVLTITIPKPETKKIEIKES